MVYKEGKLYIWGADGMLQPARNDMFVYDIDSGFWKILETQGQIQSPLSYGFCEYNDSLFVINGYDRFTASQFEHVSRLNIKGDNKEWVRYDTMKPDMAAASFGYVCEGSMVYIFGGFNNQDAHNDLWKMDLSAEQLEWIQLGRNIQIPTARSGHAMEVYDDKLYILGGVDKYGNKY
jgi:N-acetylneuraminic acid mutarotase